MTYMSEIEGVLDLVERGCTRLMRGGGGPLSKDQDWSGRERKPRTSKENVDRIVKLAQRGDMTAGQIAHALQLHPRQVRHITYYREIPLPDQRRTKQTNATL
jgi:hypothetical protein